MKKIDPRNDLRAIHADGEFPYPVPSQQKTMIDLKRYQANRTLKAEYGLSVGLLNGVHRVGCPSAAVE